MKDIDQKIREALRKEDSELLEHFRGEPALHEMIIETFRGRHRWLVVLMIVSILFALGFLVLFAFQFFLAESTRAMIGWAIGFVWGLMLIAMLKIWYWGELNKNSITREIKRLELQVANLSRRLGEE